LILQKIRWKNLLSWGNYWTEIQLDKSDITIITGDNGAGKSSMLIDTITYALFGRFFRDINKSQYVNSITKKGLLVELFFTVGKDNYKIIRGIKPDVFEIYLNDSLVPQNSDKKGYQDYLEVNVIKCGFKTFSQIVVIGSTAYKPFLTLDAKER
jgi:DNA repair exonuclease SbcCD ATPase subunit